MRQNKKCISATVGLVLFLTGSFLVNFPTLAAGSDFQSAAQDKFVYLPIVTTGKQLLADDYRLQALQTLQLLNQERARSGLPALEWDDELYRVTLQTAQWLAENHLFSHRMLSSEDRVCLQFSQQCASWSEVLRLTCYPDELSTYLWQDSDMHWQILTDPTAKRVAFAIAPISGWVQDSSGQIHQLSGQYWLKIGMISK